MNLQQIEGTTLLRFARKRINIGTFWEHPATISGRVGQSGSLIDTPFFAAPRSRFDTLFCHPRVFGHSERIKASAMARFCYGFKEIPSFSVCPSTKASFPVRASPLPCALHQKTVDGTILFPQCSLFATPF